MRRTSTLPNLEMQLWKRHLNGYGKSLVRIRKLFAQTFNLSSEFPKISILLSNQEAVDL